MSLLHLSGLDSTLNGHKDGGMSAEIPHLTTALIGMGGNLGNVRATFSKAIQTMNSRSDLHAIRSSSYFESAPIGERAGGTFLNAALAIDVDCSPHELLTALQEIETDLGRMRTIHWGPRTLDLDIIGFGNEIVATPELTIPHPACWYRRFVLDPLLDIAPDWVHPVLGESVTQLRGRLERRPLRVGVPAERPAGLWTGTLRSELRQVFSADEVELVEFGKAESWSAVSTTSELTFTFDAAVPPRVIPLTTASDPLQLAVQSVRAALDAPRPVL